MGLVLSIACVMNIFVLQIYALKFYISNSKSLEKRTFILLYRKHSSNMQQYVDKIKHILTHNSIDMVLSDFNINHLNNSESKVLKTLMEDKLQYSQIVKSPTFVSSGSRFNRS